LDKINQSVICLWKTDAMCFRGKFSAGKALALPVAGQGAMQSSGGMLVQPKDAVAALQRWLGAESPPLLLGSQGTKNLNKRNRTWAF
uniref:Uncharacterized protein n=1 Tax=Calidris pygmaea TaxID=425635 RepID=A0A8C3JP65_9CHAR